MAFFYDKNTAANRIKIKDKKMQDVLWHGRGGQGVVLAAQILGEAAYIQGFKGVTSAPTFGPERRGAPVAASTRISDEPIRTFSQIEAADVAVVLDATLLTMIDIFGRLKDSGMIIVNTPLAPDQIGIEGCFDVASVDASGIAREQRLTVGGFPIVNTPLLGAFAKATGLVSLENIERGLKKKMSGDKVIANCVAVRTAFENTIVTRHDSKTGKSDKKPKK